MQAGLARLPPGPLFFICFRGRIAAWQDDARPVPALITYLWFRKRVAPWASIAEPRPRPANRELEREGRGGDS